ncbi:MAG: class I SAM-dependent methyltransferase [Anaerolineales bacterium]|nr:class I SAM-dependent methyltransferase [Anaerolineales bacterium]NUQ83972.1 class I SAM-dependent methyltransferase [Anaerolineales bacterium]
MTTPPVCNYEGSDYQASFWDKGGREYEDRAEAIALKRLLPPGGRLLLELGAGAGRNTSRYPGFDRIILLDYSRTQLEQAQQRLGRSEKYVYVAADVYRLPFVNGLFDAATMIRVLHHMADAPKALEQVGNALRMNGVFILEFANKLNLKAILRFLLGRQKWNPFSLEPVEFARLNFDFHPKTVRNWLRELGFSIERTLTLSHFRVGLLKRIVPTDILVFFDSILQWTGAWCQLSPSVFVRATVMRDSIPYAAQNDILSYFKCPDCGHSPLTDKKDYLECSSCKKRWEIRDGIYDFREPIKH